MKIELQGLIEKARGISYQNFGRKINFYYTSNYFPAVSITGNYCELNCKHCNRMLIKRLISVKTPDSLVRECMQFKKQGARGVLITGGCTKDGKVPLYNFLDAIKEIKEETDLILIAHTGIVDYKEAKSLEEAGIDGVCVDIVGSKETTKEIYGIEILPIDYRKTLIAFEKARIRNVSPHVCVGLHYGKLKHEMKALDIISCIKPSNIVIIGLTNIMGTEMENVRIEPRDLIKILCMARIKFPHSYVSLGCARGKGKIRSEIDRLAVQAGVNNIAIPTPVAYREAEKLNLEIREYKACCSLLPEGLNEMEIH